MISHIFAARNFMFFSHSGGRQSEAGMPHALRGNWMCPSRFSHNSNLLKPITPKIGHIPVKFPLFCKKYTNNYRKFCDMSLFPKRRFFDIIYIVKKYKQKMG